jgi:putative copper resistance protein D
VTPHEALIVERMARDTGLSLIWGACGLALIAGGELQRPLAAALRRPTQIAIVLVTTSVLVAIPSETAEFGAGWQAALRPDLVWAVAFETHAGMSSTIQAATCIAMVGAFATGRKRLVTGLAALVLTEAATTGHMATELDLVGITRFAVAAVHILSAAAWVGALLTFITLIHLSRSPQLRTAAISAMGRFSRAGHLAVGLVVLTGLINSWVIVGHLPFEWYFPYQRYLLLKTAVVGAMCAIALVDRYVIVPQFRARPSFARTALIGGAACEIALGLFAFALVASFGLEDPS